MPIQALEQGQIVEGQVDGETVIIARSRGEVFAVGGVCTHCSGPLAKGIVIGQTVRCPWHHACFSLRTGEDLGAPAFDPVSCWNTELRGDRIYMTGKMKPATRQAANAAQDGGPENIVIVVRGAAGFAEAEIARARCGSSPRCFMRAGWRMSCNNASRNGMGRKL
ncbi:MAG: Rieske 2Fe-2S domain-containing protein [Rhizobiaceae bacterium]|nr:MAG: Rieske 2Fe-2S domain-containing protein [Rhizobiaceae bacterium]